MKSKLFAALAILMVLSLVLTGCQPTATAPGAGGPTFKVAIVVPLSGDVKTFGESTVTAR